MGSQQQRSELVVGRTTDSPRFNRYMSLRVMILSASNIPIPEDLKPAELFFSLHSQDHHFNTEREQFLGCPLWFESFEFTMQEDDSISIILWKWNSTYKDDMIGSLRLPVSTIAQDFQDVHSVVNGLHFAHSNASICDSFAGSRRYALSKGNGEKLEDKYGETAHVTLCCRVMNVSDVRPQSSTTAKDQIDRITNNKMVSSTNFHHSNQEYALNTHISITTITNIPSYIWNEHSLVQIKVYDRAGLVKGKYEISPEFCKMVEKKISIGYLQQIGRIIISFPGQGSTEIKSEDLLEYVGECNSGLEQVQYMLDFGFAKDKDASRTEEPTIHFLLEYSSDRTTENALKCEFREILSRVCKYSIAIKIKICDWDHFSDQSVPILVLNAGKKTIHKTLDEAYASSSSREYILEADVYQEFRIFLIETAKELRAIGSVRISMADILYSILVNDGADVVQDEIFMTFKLSERSKSQDQLSEPSQCSPCIKIAFKLFNAAKLLFGIQEFMPLGKSKGNKKREEIQTNTRKNLKINVIQCCNQPMLMSRDTLLHCRVHIGNECAFETKKQQSTRDRTVWNESFIKDVNSSERILIQVIQSNSNGNILILGEAAIDVSDVELYLSKNGNLSQQDQTIGLKLLGLNGMELKSKEKLSSYLDVSVQFDPVPSRAKNGRAEEIIAPDDPSSPSSGLMQHQDGTHDVVFDMSVIACKNIPLVPFGSKIYVQVECGDDRKYTKSRIYREEILFNETFRFLLKNNSDCLVATIVCKPQNNVHYEIGKVQIDKAAVYESIQVKQGLLSSQQHTFNQSVIRESNENVKERSIMLLGHQYPAWKAFEVRNEKNESIMGETGEPTQVLINLAAHNSTSHQQSGARPSSPKDTPVAVNVTFAEDIVPFVLDNDLLNGWKLEVLHTIAQVLNEPQDRFDIASVYISDCINVRLLIRPTWMIQNYNANDKALALAESLISQARHPSSYLRQIHPTISDCEMLGDFNHFQIDDFVSSHDLVDSDTSRTIEHDSSSISSALGLLEFEESRVEADDRRGSAGQGSKPIKSLKHKDSSKNEWLKRLAEICKQNRESRTRETFFLFWCDVTTFVNSSTRRSGPAVNASNSRSEADGDNQAYHDGNRGFETSRWMMAKCSECKIFKRRERLNSSGKCPRCARNS
uniref:C2 domain-containing protein n=1 Tax=Guillardia theta TaxID=55529 RepID=A0A6U6E2X5_GUITH